MQHWTKRSGRRLHCVERSMQFEINRFLPASVVVGEGRNASHHARVHECSYGRANLTPNSEDGPEYREISSDRSIEPGMHSWRNNFRSPAKCIWNCCLVNMGSLKPGANLTTNI